MQDHPELSKQTAEQKADPSKQTEMQKRRPLWRRLLSWKAFLLYFLLVSLAYPLIGFFAIPPLIQHVLLPDINKDIRGQVKIERIQVNPYTFRMVMEGIELQDEQANQVAMCRRFTGDLEFSSLWRRGIIFKELLVEQPDLDLKIDAHGAVNVIRTLEPLEPRLPEIKDLYIPLLTVEDCQVQGASFRFEDARVSPAFTHGSDSVDFSMKNFTTAEGVYTPSEITLVTDLDESVTVHADIRAKPIALKGNADIDAVNLPHYVPYLKQMAGLDEVQLSLVDGTLDLNLNWHVDLLGDAQKVNLGMSDLDLKSVTIEQGKADTPLARLATVSVSGVDVNLVDRSIEVTQVDVQDGQITTRLLANGQLDVLETLAPMLKEINETDDGKVAPPKMEAIVEIVNAFKRMPTQVMQLPMTQSALSLAEAALTKPWRVSILKTRILNQKVNFTDEMPEPDVALNLADLNIQVGQIASENGFKLPVTLSGSLLQSQQSAKLEAVGSVDPLKQSAELKATASGIEIAPFSSYASPYVHAEVTQGVLTAQGHVMATLNDAKTGGLAYGFEGHAAIETLGIRDSRGKMKTSDTPLIAFQKLDVKAVKASGPRWALAAERIQVVEPRLKAELKKNGELAILDLLKTSENKDEVSTERVTSSSGIPPIVLPIDLNLKKIMIEKGEVDFKDNTPQKPFATILRQLLVELGPVELKSGQPLSGKVPLKVMAGIDKAELAAEGEVDLDKFAASLKVSAKALNISPFMTYTDELVLVEVRRGRLTASGHAEATLKDPVTGALAYGFEGDVQIDDFEVYEALKETGLAADPKNTLVSFKKLAVKNTKAAGPKWMLHASQVMLEKPTIRAEIKEDGKPAMLDILNFAKEVKQQVDAEAQTQAQLAAVKVDASILPPITLPVDLNIQEVNINQGEVVLKDRSQSPTFVTGMSDLNVVIGPLRDQPQHIADFKIDGHIAGRGKLELKGRGAPLDLLRETKAQMSLNGMPLLPFDPFMRRYAGYTLDRGQVSRLASQVTINKGLLDIQNTIVLGTLYFGDKVPSKEAINAPLKMGLALLRDKDDQISLDIPLHGDLNNPKFKIVPVIKSAITNRFKQVAAAPFDTLAGAAGLMGKIVGGKKPDLSQIHFGRGNAVPEKDEAKKIDHLVKALKARPDIQLAFAVHPGQDEVNEVRQRKLKKMMAEKLSLPESSLIDEAYREAIKSYFAYLRTVANQYLEEEVTTEKVEAENADASEATESAQSSDAPSKAPSIEPILPLEVIESIMLDSVTVEAEDLKALNLAREKYLTDKMSKAGLFERVMKADIQAGKGITEPHLVFEIR